MKKTLIITAALMSLTFQSCFTPKGAVGAENATATEAAKNSNSSTSALVGSLLSGLVSSVVPVTESTLYGTWQYTSPECRFESENALAKAGGAVAAATVEGKLESVYSAIGIKPGSCSFTFNEDKTCTMVFGGVNIGGTYTFNASTKELNIVSNTRLIKLNAKVYYDLGQLIVLFDAQKLLSMAQAIATFTGKGSGTMATLSSLLSSYDGMLIGMNLKK